MYVEFSIRWRASYLFFYGTIKEVAEWLSYHILTKVQINTFSDPLQLGFWVIFPWNQAHLSTVANLETRWLNHSSSSLWVHGHRNAPGNCSADELERLGTTLHTQEELERFLVRLILTNIVTYIETRWLNYSSSFLGHRNAPGNCRADELKRPATTLHTQNELERFLVRRFQLSCLERQDLSNRQNCSWVKALNNDFVEAVENPRLG